MSGNVDYTARDFSEIVELIGAEVRRQMPHWDPVSGADIGLTLVELLAAAADRAAYDQDVVATEAYIGTARLRRSVVRHARLLGVPSLEGTNARTILRFDLDVDEFDDNGSVHVPAGTAVFTGRDGVSNRVEPDEADGLIDAGKGRVFETMHSVELRPEWAQFDIYTDDDVGSPPAGATSASLVGHHHLVPGMLLGFTCDDAGAHAVRLRSVRHSSTGSGAALTHVAWSAWDAMSEPIRADTAAFGNLVFADHGRTRREVPIEPAGVDRRKYRLAPCRLTWAEAFDPTAPVRESFQRHDGAAQPAFTLTERWDDDGERNLPGARDLIGGVLLCAIERDEDDGFLVRCPTAVVRDGDPAVATAILRLGAGRVGNVAAGAIRHVVSSDTRIAGVANIVAATGGTGHETIDELRTRAPHVWRRTDVCVAATDYVDAALTHPVVVAASATRTASRVAGVENISLTVCDATGCASSALIVDVRRLIEGRRILGHVVDVTGPSEVQLEARIRVVTDQPGGNLGASVRDALGTSSGQAFDSDVVGLGNDVFRSRLTARLAAVDGVHAVHLEELRRVDGPTDRDAASPAIRIGQNEIARLDTSESATALLITMETLVQA